MKPRITRTDKTIYREKLRQMAESARKRKARQLALRKSLNDAGAALLKSREGMVAGAHERAQAAAMEDPEAFLAQLDAAKKDELLLTGDPEIDSMPLVNPGAHDILPQGIAAPNQGPPALLNQNPLVAKGEMAVIRSKAIQAAKREKARIDAAKLQTQLGEQTLESRALGMEATTQQMEIAAESEKRAKSMQPLIEAQKRQHTKSIKANTARTWQTIQQGEHRLTDAMQVSIPLYLDDQLVGISPAWRGAAEQNAHATQWPAYRLKAMQSGLSEGEAADLFVKAFDDGWNNHTATIRGLELKKEAADARSSGTGSYSSGMLWGHLHTAAQSKHASKDERMMLSTLRDMANTTDAGSVMATEPEKIAVFRKVMAKMVEAGEVDQIYLDQLDSFAKKMTAKPIIQTGFIAEDPIPAFNVGTSQQAPRQLNRSLGNIISGE